MMNMQIIFFFYLWSFIPFTIIKFDSDIGEYI